MRKKVKIGFVLFIYSSKYHGKSVNFFVKVDFCEMTRTDIIVVNFYTPHGDQLLSSVGKAFIEHTHSLFLSWLPCRVARRLFGIQLVSVLKDGGMKERKRANSDPKTSDAVVAGRTNDHRVRETRKNKVLKTKDNRRWFAPPFYPLLPRIHFSPCVSTRISRRRCCLKDATFLSLLSRAVSLAHSFLQTPWRFSCLISQLTLRNIRIASFVRTAARPWFTTIFVSTSLCVAVSALIMRASVRRCYLK